MPTGCFVSSIYEKAVAADRLVSFFRVSCVGVTREEDGLGISWGGLFDSRPTLVGCYSICICYVWTRAVVLTHEAHGLLR